MLTTCPRRRGLARATKSGASSPSRPTCPPRTLVLFTPVTSGPVRDQHDTRTEVRRSRTSVARGTEFSATPPPGYVSCPPPHNHELVCTNSYEYCEQALHELVKCDDVILCVLVKSPTGSFVVLEEPFHVHKERFFCPQKIISRPRNVVFAPPEITSAPRETVFAPEETISSMGKTVSAPREIVCLIGEMISGPRKLLRAGHFVRNWFEKAAIPAR